MSKILVGLSGGVDSAVSALMLVQQGHQVEGLFMKNWEEDDNDEYCSAAIDISDAQEVCRQLGIPLHSVNFAAEYWDRVFENFLAEYQAGRTPNPDILCNKEIKFKAFLNYALTHDYDAIATGHYVRTRQVNGTYQLLKGLDQNKDQSYFLYTLGQTPLKKSIFPIGALEKSEVRAIAAQAGLINHNKKDSTGICFIGERKFKDFLSRYLPAKPGIIKDIDGRVLGEHQGLMYYTLGQRQGLGIGGKKQAQELPWYVAMKDLNNNELIVVQEQQHPILLKTRLTCRQLHWVNPEQITDDLNAQAKIRYRAQDQACQIKKINEDCFQVIFVNPQWAVTAGQSIVFYQDEVCLGGGIIEASE
jgi:tRNA-specific 2-thiouridylase